MDNLSYATQRCWYQVADGPTFINPLMPNDHYSGRTAPLTSKRYILYIYSTNIGTEYFKVIYTVCFFSSKCSLFHNSNVFGSCIIHILYTVCAKIKKKFRRQKVRLFTEVAVAYQTVVNTSR